MVGAVGASTLGAGCARPCPAIQAPVEPSVLLATAERQAEPVVLNRLGGAAEQVALVVERREALVAVRYAEGLVEWVSPDAVRPLAALQGRQVDALLAGPTGGATVASVNEVAGDLVHVTLPGGEQAWLSAATLGRVHPQPTPPGQQPTPPDQAPPPPARQPVDPGLIRAGATVMVNYSGSPYLGRVVIPGRGRVYVRWVEDGSEEWVAASDVVRIYPPVAEAALAVGARVWYRGSAGLVDGVVAERRGGFSRVVVVDDSPPGEWIERSSVVAVLDPVPSERLTPGAHVGVISGGAIAGAVVLGPPDGGEVRLRWDDGGQEATTSLSDVVELW